MLRRKYVIALFLALTVVVAAAGCGQKTPAQPAAALVKTMSVIKRDTPIIYEYSSFVEAQKEIELKARVSGMVIEKHINGGDSVQQGQLLYVIDPRSYESTALNYQAQLANAQSEFSRQRVDAERYQQLYAQGAISKQSLDNTMAALEQSEAQVNAQQALLAAAQVDASETRVLAPFSGKVSTDDVAVGTFVTLGSTVLTTISNSDPVLVSFNISEAEYLKLMAARQSSVEGLTLTLADESVYPFSGRLTQVDRGIGTGTGTLTLKAEFTNPDNMLLPGMFAHLKVNVGTVKDAMLVPQRAVTEIMYKYFVYTVDKDNVVDMKEVKLGARVGRLWLVESGLDGNETIVVEGTQKVKKGATVQSETMTEADLDTSVSKS